MQANYKCFRDLFAKGTSYSNITFNDTTILGAGLSWKNESNSSSIEEGDKVTFTTAVKNTSNVDI